MVTAMTPTHVTHAVRLRVTSTLRNAVAKHIGRADAASRAICRPATFMARAIVLLGTAMTPTLAVTVVPTLSVYLKLATFRI